MKKIFSNFIIFIIIVLVAPSCRNKCKYVNCQNGGSCDEGNCQCVNGYTGKNCEIAPLDFEIIATPVSGTAPLKVDVTCRVKSGTITRYEWNFGNGRTSEGITASYTYTEGGSYRIVLLVTSLSPGDNTRAQTIDVKALPKPPTCNFAFSPQNDIIANTTSIQFRNLTTGDYTSQKWVFAAESTSSSKDPAYTFTKEGNKIVALNIYGTFPATTCTVGFKVHAMPPSCNNYNDGSTQSEDKIRSLRNAGLKTGRIVINNDYGAPVRIELYHPDEWLIGRYSSYANLQWPISASTISRPLGYNGTAYNIGNDWGIKILFSNGFESCIRSVNSVATYQNNTFTIKATNIYN